MSARGDRIDVLRQPAGHHRAHPDPRGHTSFTGFPFLVSFVAEDSFLPRQLTVRGHRLVFSNGIIVLAVVSIALLVATGDRVASLIPMYAIGVFTGFTMAGAGIDPPSPSRS
jgi:hypothetical protein